MTVTLGVFLLNLRTCICATWETAMEPHRASWPIFQPSQPTSNYTLLPSLVGVSAEWVVTLGRAFSPGVSPCVPLRKPLFEAFLTGFSQKNRKNEKIIRNGSLRKRSSTTRPKTRATHQHPGEVGGHGRSHGLNRTTFGARPPGSWA